MQSSTMFLKFVILAIICFFIYNIFRKRLQSYLKTLKLLQAFDGPPGLPILGNLLQLTVHHHELLSVVTKWFKCYGGEFRVWLGLTPIVVLGTASSVQRVLTSSSSTVKGEEAFIFHSWLGSGLFFATGTKWAMLRKLLTPAFHFEALTEFVKVFNTQSQVLVDVLTERQGTASEVVVDILPFINRCTLDMICENAMGKKMEAQRKPDSAYSIAVKEYCEVLLHRVLSPWLRPKFLWNVSTKGTREKVLLKTLHGFTEEVIVNKKLERLCSTNSAVRKQDFLYLILDASENGSVLSDKDIREQTDTFTFGGHDTSAISISTTLFFLANNPDCQEKALEEVRRVLGDDWTQEITVNHLMEMKYLEACVKENLRIFPPVPFMTREIEEDIQLEDGRVIPKRITAFLSPYLLHRDESVFPNAEVFDPERFSLENTIGRNPYAYIPFSAGPRNCIGQRYAYLELKTTLAKMLLNFRMEGVEEMKEIHMVPHLVLRPIQGVKIKLFKRNV